MEWQPLVLSPRMPSPAAVPGSRNVSWCSDSVRVETPSERVVVGEGAGAEGAGGEGAVRESAVGRWSR